MVLRWSRGWWHACRLSPYINGPVHFSLGISPLLADEIDRPCARAGCGEDGVSDAGGSADEGAAVESVICYRSLSGSSVSAEDGVDDEQEPAAAADPIPRGTGFNLEIQDQYAREILALQALYAEASEGV